MKTNTQYVVLCNGVELPSSLEGTIPKGRIIRLNNHDKNSDQNVSLKVYKFISHLIEGITNRVHDLVEIAAFVYAADRFIDRGDTDQLEYHNWARELIFYIPIRDIKFWEKTDISKKLSEALTFVSGDKSYDFIFSAKEGSNEITSLFHNPINYPDIPTTNSYPVALFSGGLDSLAGVISLLEETSQKIVITSHRSNTKTTNVQNRVYEALRLAYPDRLLYHALDCRLTGKISTEETQRTRFFLYTTIGFALAVAYGQNELNIFENGITSINLSKRQDLINARASRTTHPKTLGLLQQVFSGVYNKEFTVKHPFLYLTKTDVVNKIKEYSRQDIIRSTVTCTKTFQSFKNNTSASHCGYCSQCVDRRFAMYAAGLENFDAIYNFDLTIESFEHRDARTHVIDYINHAYSFATTHFGEFCELYLDPLSDLTNFISFEEAEKEVERLFNLYKKHSRYVEKAYTIMQNKHYSIFDPERPNSIYDVVNRRHFQRTPVERLAEDIAKNLNDTIPIALARITLKHENALNDHIQAILKRDGITFEREYPSVKFSYSKVVPDHSTEAADSCLYIESKYIRGKTPPSTVTDQIVSDLGKYPVDAFKLFIVYDPLRKIKDDKSFKGDYERRMNCMICIIR